MRIQYTCAWWTLCTYIHVRTYVVLRAHTRTYVRTRKSYKCVHTHIYVLVLQQTHTHAHTSQPLTLFVVRAMSAPFLASSFAASYLDQYTAAWRGDQPSRSTWLTRSLRYSTSTLHTEEGCDSGLGGSGSMCCVCGGGGVYTKLHARMYSMCVMSLCRCALCALTVARLCTPLPQRRAWGWPGGALKQALGLAPSKPWRPPAASSSPNPSFLPGQCLQRGRQTSVHPWGLHSPTLSPPLPSITPLLYLSF